MTLPGWLDDPALDQVWQRLRGPLERNAATTRLAQLPRETRHALAGVLGRPVAGDLRLRLAELDAVLRERADLPLAVVVESATGRPLRDRTAEQQARQAPLDVLRQVDPDWADAVRTAGLLARARDALAVAEAAVRVRAQLPGPPRLRTELAATVTGDAHALDEGRTLAAVVLRSLAQGPAPTTATERRALWERAGVLPDQVSASVLTLGLRPLAPGRREDRLRAAADDGDPLHLSAWDLARAALALDGRTPVLVVENPSVLEAVAVRYGGAWPVVCTSGWPASVALALLDALHAPLAYSGDLDWRGLEIASWLVRRCGVRPWRMGTADYLAAPSGAALDGRPAVAVWDARLGAAMRRRGTAVHQEQVLEQLVEQWPIEQESAVTR
ncbi:MAG: TIGR02679 family protein [Actinomycetota bacterium]|nr:TIGR02679 family protein [Actinomycetota bacterium]